MSIGYYLSDPGSVVTLPAHRLDSELDQTERDNIEHVTDRGKRWIYDLYERGIWRIKFRLTPSQLTIIETLDTAVDGNRVPFYFVPVIGASPLSARYVRKERDFKPLPLGRASSGGSVVLMYDYEMILTEEPTGIEVEP